MSPSPLTSNTGHHANSSYIQPNPTSHARYTSTDSLFIMGTTSSVLMSEAAASTSFATARFWNTTTLLSSHNTTSSDSTASLLDDTSSVAVKSTSNPYPVTPFGNATSSTSTSLLTFLESPLSLPSDTSSSTVMSSSSVRSISNATTTLPGVRPATVIVTTSLSDTASSTKSSPSPQLTPLPVVTDGTTTTCSELSCMPSTTRFIPTAKACIPLSPDCPQPPPCLFGDTPCPISTETDNQKQLIGMFRAIFPTIQHLIEHNDDDIKPVIDGLNKIKAFLVTLHDHEGGGGGRGGGGGSDCHKSLFDLLGCAANSVTDITGKITSKVLTGLQDQLLDLQSLVSFIPKVSTISGPPGGGGGGGSGVGEGNVSTKAHRAASSLCLSGEMSLGAGSSLTRSPQEGPTSSGSALQASTASESFSSSTFSSSSSESCTQTTTVQDIQVTCSATTTVSVSGTISTYVCATTSSMISGCSVSGTTTTTSVLATETTDIVSPCRVDDCGAECSTKRQLFARGNGSVFEGGLYKRIFATYPEINAQGGYGVWLNTNLGKLDVAPDRIVPHDVRKPVKSDGTTDNDREVDGATSWRTVEFQKQWTGLGLRGLKGCTSIIVVSKKGAFMAHTWEIPAWIRDTKHSLNRPDMVEQLSWMWQQDVGDTPFKLRYKAEDGKEYKGLIELSGGGELLDDPLYAMIVTPYKVGNEYPHWNNAGRTYRYQPRVELLQGYLESRLGIPTVDVQGYNPAASGNLLSNFRANGRVLLEFDPEARKTTTQARDAHGNVCTGVKVEAGFRLWVDENQLVHEDYWDPLDVQRTADEDDSDDGSSTPRPPGSPSLRGLEESMSSARNHTSMQRARVRRQDVPVCSKISTDSDWSTISTFSATSWSSFSSMTSTLFRVTSSSSSSSPSEAPSSSSMAALSTQAAAGFSSPKPTTFVSSTTSHATDTNGCYISAYSRQNLPVLSTTIPGSSICVCKDLGYKVTIATKGSSTYCEAPGSTTTIAHVVTEALTESITSRSDWSYATVFSRQVCHFGLHGPYYCTEAYDTRTFPTHTILPDILVPKTAATTLWEAKVVPGTILA
ncbi:hypothetical protein DOTSEDRAFT_39677 [Dothistroma septosporum NZE10]|uniref:Uncharacterized protein n=1 Tax=Dothistroma septosporum (strain NZE10 / CBS 128990) TaxID=675120 RepID=M2XGE6_DOTSN|nr:hypothetical protein DOTSEDRAFT_39677 [Dothistroma septosporum NZE10]